MASGTLPLDDTYHRASHIGEGSFGSVIVVYNNDGQEFALKRFLMEEDESIPIELGALREISILRLLRHSNGHSNIVPLMDCTSDYSESGEEEEEGGGCLGLILPKYPCSLADAIQSQAVVQCQKAVKVHIAFGLLHAIRFLHENGILHRDLKSDNVLLTDSFEPVLIDFSLAKPIDATIWGNFGDEDDDHPLDNTTMEAIAHTGEVGTVVYTAPEIVQQEAYGKPSELYSVGVILLELLLGKIFTAEKQNQATLQLQAALQEELPPTKAPFPTLVRQLLLDSPQQRPTVQAALQHELFVKFGLPTTLQPIQRINVATALPYETDDEQQEEENEPPPRSKKKPHRPKQTAANKKRQRRLQRIDKILHHLESVHPLTKWAALEYSEQMEQLDDEMDDSESSSQTLLDCCVLAHRFFELELPDLDDLDETDTGLFANWNLADYVDNEASILMILDYCLYPRRPFAPS